MTLPLPSLPDPPRIAPVPAGVARPRWSVMIPTFNCANYLRQTLESVLAQDPGPDQMQIEVVDDCSTQDDPLQVVQTIGQGRVRFFRQPANRGVTGNFNTCIERSIGEFIHLLHGDDYILPGFYSRVEQTMDRHPSVSAVFARCFIVDADGTLEGLSGRLGKLETPSTEPGELFYRNEIRTPGVVVRRSFYEKHGGFAPQLIHAADWEMWIRVICRERGVFLNEPVAAYRQFADNDTGRLARTAENLRDYLRLKALFEAANPSFEPVRFLEVVATLAEWQCEQFRKRGDEEAAKANFELWRELTPASRVFTKKLKATLQRLMGRRP